MPAPGRSKQIFHAALAGDALTERDANALVGDRVPEDQWLEYKQQWPDPNVAVKELRRHVTGFANAEGGLLLVGIAGGEGDPPVWGIPGVREGGRAAARWAETTLQSIGPRLNPAPRIQAVQCGNTAVLAIAVDRAFALVPVTEGSELKYYLRIGDSTVTVPPFLYADLTLQRRARPHLVLKLQVQGGAALNDGLCWVAVTLTVENDGFTWADDVRVGLIGQALRPDSPHYQKPEYNQRVDEVSDAATRFIDAVRGGMSEGIHRCESAIGTLEPLSRETRCLRLFMGRGGVGGLLTWRGAAYVYARESPPRWFQVGVTFEIAGTVKTECEVGELAEGKRAQVYWGTCEALLEATNQS